MHKLALLFWLLQSSVSGEMPLEVNLVNLVDILQKVTDVDDLGLHLGVPKHELDEIRQDFSTTKERKKEMLQFWLNHTPNPTWERVTTALRAMGKLAIANAVTNVSKRTSLYELPKEDLQKWEEENIKMQTSLEKKLEEVQQRSEHLEEEWGKGEKEWREYLVKLEKIEKDWEDIVRRQRTERAFLTLGISWLFQSDIKSLHRYSLLEDKVQRHMARSEELRKFYKDTREHQHG